MMTWVKMILMDNNTLVSKQPEKPVKLTTSQYSDIKNGDAYE